MTRKRGSYFVRSRGSNAEAFKHSDVATTLRIYVDVLPEDLERAAGRERDRRRTSREVPCQAPLTGRV